MIPSSMRVLFVSRAYPPIIGGIENQNAGIADALRAYTPVTCIVNTRGKKFLPLFIPYALIRVLLVMHRHDTLLIGDGVLAPLAAAVRMFFPHKTYAAIIHGLDVTYAQKTSLLSSLYKYINIPSLRMLDRLIMVGQHTIDQAVAAGVNRAQCTFIPNGLWPDALYAPTRSRDDLNHLCGRDLTGSPVIVRIGRFVPHKGVPWFITNVLPHLPSNTIFIAAGGRTKKTAGDRDVYDAACAAARAAGIADRVILMTNISDDDRLTLLNTADLVVSPNITIPGSMEGFGINAIEAAVCARVVLAANLQGIPDAIHDGKNGLLVTPEDPAAWIAACTRVMDTQFDRSAFGARARIYTTQHFAWPVIAKAYCDVLHTQHTA